MLPVPLLALLFSILPPSFAGDESIQTPPIETSYDDSYSPEFLAFSKSITGRADGSSNTILQNNVPASGATISPGSIQFFTFPSSALHGAKSTASPAIPSMLKVQADEDHHELRKRATDVTYYLTINTCTQPASTTQSDPPPQLRLFVSDSNPQPDGSQPSQVKTPQLVDGHADFSDQQSGDLYVGVQALSAAGYTGSYTFELTVSIDTFYASYVADSNLYWVDSDSAAAMFVSGNITAFDPEDGIVDNAAVEQWQKMGPRYRLLLTDTSSKQFNGLTRSYCALKNTTSAGSESADQTNVNVETGLTTIGGPSLQQQFFLSGLQPGKNYSAIMALPSNYSSSGSGQPTGGGTVFKQLFFQTKTGKAPLATQIAYPN